MRKAPNKIAVETLLGMPKATVVAGAEHSFHSAFTEAFFIRRALNGIGVCHPLGCATPHSGKYADVGAERATFENQPPVAKGIFHPFHNAAEFFDLFPGNARSLDGQVDNLRDGKQSYSHGNESNAVPQEDRRPLSQDSLKSEARDAPYRIQADGGNHEPEAPSHETLDDVPAAQRSNKGDGQKGEHEEFRRADGEDQRRGDRDRQRQDKGTENGADQGTHQGCAQGSPGFSLLGHWVTIDDGGSCGAFTRDAEKDRGNISGRGRYRV
jgi:hypothetical protein